MLRFGTIAVLVVMFITGAVVSCGGGSIMDGDYPSQAVVETTGGELINDGEVAAGDGLPAIPTEPTADVSRDLSWVTAIDPQSPLASHRAYNCAAHPGCYVLEGLSTMPLTHMPPRPYFACAFYEAPLGAVADDLLSLKITGQVAHAGEEYYVAVANYTAMAWEWYGPAGAAMDYTVDFSSITWDYTSAWDSMYFVVVAPQGNMVHLRNLELEFEDGDDPTWWNVWGEAYNNVGAGSAAAGLTVEFIDTSTSVMYTTVTAADGGWGTNLPTGIYQFTVIGNEMLFDEAGYMVIEELPVVLEVTGMGEIVYHGTNPAYDGNVIPMPIITCNAY